MEVWTRNTCSFHIVPFKFIFVSADAEAGLSRPFPRHQRRIQKCETKKIEKGPNNAELGLIVTTGEIQAESQTDHAKAVAGGTHPGCGRALLRRTPGGGKPGPSFSGGCMPPCKGRFHLLPNLDATNHPSSTIKREALPPFQHTHHLETIYLTPLTCIFSLD